MANAPDAPTGYRVFGSVGRGYCDMDSRMGESPFRAV